MSNLTQFYENPKLVQLLKDSGSMDTNKAIAASRELAIALEAPLRKGVMSGDIINGIFEPIPLAQSSTNEFPLDFLAPGTEKQFIAYTIPNHGYMPQRTIAGDYVMVPTYEIGNTIDWHLKYARDARWDVVSRALEVLNMGFTKKMNDDGWSVLLASGVDRNVVVYDSDAAAGQFTKRLVSLMKTIMRRNGGGNSSSTNRGMLTDLYISPEAMEDIRNWNVDQVDEITRREIYVASDNGVTLNRIFGVNLHDIDELGVGQEYQTYFTNELGGSFTGSDEELVVGLDLTNRDSFIMPVRQTVQVFPDESMHRSRRMGYYAWAELGFAALDTRRILLGTF